MSSVRMAAVAAGVTVAAAMGAAQAADVSISKEPDYIDPLPAAELRGGVYIRGYAGMTNQEVRGLDFIELHDPNYQFTFLDKGSFDSGPLFGAGLGYRFNEWFRMDLTGEYRGKVDFTALDHAMWVGEGGPVEWTNDHRAKKSEWLFLVNAYLDLGTWKGLTPYVGAGLGASRNTISSYRDTNVSLGGVWHGSSNSKWNLAWALHAGLGFEVTDQLTLDLAYRYVDLGDARTGPIHHVWDDQVLTPVHFDRLTSHDVMLGMRWSFGHEPGYGAPSKAFYKN